MKLLSRDITVTDEVRKVCIVISEFGRGIALYQLAQLKRD
jgi:hypothetical protein